MPELKKIHYYVSFIFMHVNQEVMTLKKTEQSKTSRLICAMAHLCLAHYCAMAHFAVFVLIAFRYVHIFYNLR